MSRRQVDQLFARARGEFLEMPGMRLTSRQAARLWALDPHTSEHLLDGLVRAGFLWKSAGTYRLASFA